MRSRDASVFTSKPLLRIYYAATLLFVILDYFLNINVRLAFLEAWPEMRAFYYLLLFVCLGLMFLQPGWSLCHLVRLFARYGRRPEGVGKQVVG